LHLDQTPRRVRCHHAAHLVSGEIVNSNKRDRKGEDGRKLSGLVFRRFALAAGGVVESRCLECGW
jgi:hypothetical protein